MNSLPKLALFLRNEKLIAAETEEASSVLLKEVKEAVCADYHNLKKFAAILMKLQPVVPIAHSLLENYSEATNVYTYSKQFNLFSIGKAFADERSTITISRENGKVNNVMP